MNSAPAQRRFRLLPPGSPLGWTPYAWLVYLATFLVEPIHRTRIGHAGTLYWMATAFALALFLLSYFSSYWQRGVRLLAIIALQAGLAIAFAPINAGSCVFFVYAAATAGRLDPTRAAGRGLAIIVVLGAATALLVQNTVFFWLTSVGVSLLVGGVNLHFAQVDRAQDKLRLAQNEIEQLAAVAERERIARDLHDVLGHTLSLIVLKAELAAKLAERDPARAAAEMRDVETVARRTLQDVREAIRGYRTTLADEGPRAKSLLRAAGISAQLELEAGDLPQAVDETLAFALREAVTNVVRHSGAASCTVRARRAANAVILDIEDDGRGSHAQEGAGLRGMRDRVEAFGGTIARLQGHGLHLRITLPLSHSPSDALAFAEAR
jgi:two-component system sensor histidine kinase DesK